MDNSFCVLKGIFRISMRVVYGSALIKKSLYWPRGVYGDSIFTSGFKIGYMGCLSGEWEETEFNFLF